MKITEEQLEAIKILGEYQMAKGVYALYDISPLIGFENEESGIFIQNPFVDECSWFDVNPIEYYGEEFLNSDFLKIDFDDIEVYKNTKIIVFFHGRKVFEGMSYDLLDEKEYSVEIEEVVFDAIRNSFGFGVFPSGVWKIYTKEKWENVGK